MEIYNTKAPVQIYSLYLQCPQDYRDKLVETTYKLKPTVKDDFTFQLVFNETKQERVVATGYQAWVDDPIYTDLLTNIVNVVQFEISKDKNHNLELENAWAGIYKKGQFAHSHHHSPSLWSYCYYMKAEPPYTPMVFDHCGVSIDAITDLLIVFPSYLYHSVPPVVGSERVFIAGNIKAAYDENKPYNLNNEH